MKDWNNIEELFRESLQHAEADPGANTWQAIQSKMAMQQAAGTTAATAVKAGISATKIILITASVSVLAGLGIGYSLFNDKPAVSENKLSENTTNINQQTKEENAVLNENGSENENSTESSLVLIQDESNGQEKPTRVKVKVKDYSGAGSVADRFMTPKDKKEKLMSSTNGENVNNHNETNEKTELVNVKEDQIKLEVEKQKLNAHDPVAAIVSSKTAGFAPLVIDFKNYEDVYSCEWNFGDGNVSTEKSPQHIFEKPGTYNVSVTVHDKEGRKATDQATIVVKQNAVLTIETPVNVITPHQQDGFNDHLSGKEMGIVAENYTQFQIIIFDMNGNALFQSNNPEFVWDATDRSGNIVPKGTYLYQIKLIGVDGSVIKKSERITVE